MESYRIAILGGTGVGKTYFLASYFYAKRHGKRIYSGRYPINIAKGSEEIVREITNITTLFGKEPMPGTDDRYNITFSIPKLDMQVTLFDLQGGETTKNNDDNGKENSLSTAFKEDLEQADAVLFFISAYDALHNHPKIIDQTEAFINRMEQIQRENEKIKSGTDIPVYFVFTKGDSVEDENPTLETLMDNLGILPENAGYDISWKRHFKLLWKNGKYTRPFLTASLGKWENNLPPAEEEYKPVNVVETMEKLFKDMRSSRHPLFKWIKLKK
ncbi:MAG: hypothetical protein ACOYD9_05855 [Pyramidobacter sp.]